MSTTVTIPLSALKFLYNNKNGKSVVCEIDINFLKEFNQVSTINEMFEEARMKNNNNPISSV